MLRGLGLLARRRPTSAAFPPSEESSGLRAHSFRLTVAGAAPDFHRLPLSALSATAVRYQSPAPRARRRRRRTPLPSPTTSCSAMSTTGHTPRHRRQLRQRADPCPRRRPTARGAARLRRGRPPDPPGQRQRPRAARHRARGALRTRPARRPERGAKTPGLTLPLGGAILIRTSRY